MIINKTSEVIRHVNSVPMVTFGRSRMSLSKGAVEKFKFEVGMYMHFEYADNKWFFIVNDDPSGFKLCLNNKAQGILAINNRSFLSYFFSETKRHPTCSFYIQKTRSTLKGCQLFEIMSNKSREEIYSSTARIIDNRNKKHSH